MHFLCGLVSPDIAAEAKAAAGDVPVVFINNAPPDSQLEKDRYIYVASDEFMAGQYQAEYILEKFSSKDEINVVILKGPKGASGTTGRTNGLKRTLKASGKIRYKTHMEDFVLQEGDGIFVNSGVLHYLQPVDSKKNVRLQVQFVDRYFLAGTPGSLLDIKYIVPVQEQSEALLLERCDKRGQKILEKMEEAAQLCLKDEPFFELRLRSIYSELWELLFTCAMG